VIDTKEHIGIFAMASRNLWLFWIAATEGHAQKPVPH